MGARGMQVGVVAFEERKIMQIGEKDEHARYMCFWR
jgi:hypothetical protein